ncbi:MAG: hypothetical protein RIS31_614 [Actinomycetota bacterium]
MKPTITLSNLEAKAIALDALGFGDNRPTSVLEVFDRTNLLQVDSVNVFERAHYMPLFSRLGRYDKDELDSLTGGFNPKLIEYWAHEASIIKTDELPLFHWRMSDNRYRNWDEKLGTWIENELRTRGPLTTSDLEHPDHARKGSWWGWSDVKRTLERMFYCGALVSGGRTKFKRIYALPEQILPSRLMENAPSKHEAQKELLVKSAASHGLGTQKDLADYFRIWQPSKLTPLLHELVEEGRLLKADVAGWDSDAYIHPAANLSPTKHSGTTILSPFDPVCWNRERTSRIFGFDYKIEIYVPEPQRKFGYYSLPVLHNGNLIARLDLKSNRQENVLQVKSSWAEETILSKFPTNAVAKHLQNVAKWQGLGAIEIAEKGNVSLELGANLL